MPVVIEDFRKLATVEQITEIREIEGADAIVQAKVRGWSVVIKKGEFNDGDKVVYFETDTALPISDERFAFLASRGTRSDKGEDFHVLKIARLRGVYSQGLVLPLSAFSQEITEHFPGSDEHALAIGTDLTKILNLGKWDNPIPVGRADTAGAFLTEYIGKTDSERVQNLSSPSVWESIRSFEWEASEKIDGTSCTVVRDVDENLRVMSRNWEIRDGDNVYWNTVRRFAKLFEVLEPGDALQFEIAGPGIQGNKLRISDVRPFIFDMARNGVMLPRSEWPEEVLEQAVPLVTIEIPESIDTLISQVDGMKSTVNPQVLAEGVVFHTKDGRTVPEVGNRNTFKVISGKFLLKSKD